MHMIFDGPPDAPKFLMAHGAGGAMDNPWMNRVAAGLGARGIRVVRFEFPYMAARRHGGKRGAPDRAPVLLSSWKTAIAETGDPRALAIGGKSLGGRMASMVADEMQVQRLICFGYPFHPPGDNTRLRTEHLADLSTRTLIIQGTRDPFGNQGEVAQYKLSASIEVAWLEDGDHPFKPRASSGITEKANLERAIDLAASSIFGED